jgi:phage terminase small subunit
VSNDQEVGTLPAKVTDKQRRFIEEYCADFNAAQAAIRSGYSETSARNIGCENLTKPYIRAAIRERLNELTMSSAEAAMRLTRWGRGSLRPFLRITADGEAVVDLSTAEAQDQLDLIRRIKQTEQTIRSKDGSEYTTVRIEIELHDPKDAIVQMAKLHGMFRERVDDAGEEEMTPERRAELWERLRRIQSIEELEKLLVASAEEQAAAKGVE